MSQDDDNEESSQDIDEEFFHYSAHIDQALISKIEEGKLSILRNSSKEKILHKDGQLQMIKKESLSYLQPVSEKDAPSIHNLRKMGTGI